MRRPTDWPTDTGPVRTLQDLGMIDGDRPPWALNMRHQDDAYICYSRYLTNNAIRDLAALSFELYTIDVEAGARSDLLIRIIDRK